ncbi:MAG: tRNA uridine-5-carboxymethylaminomethyl(34) synthesis GTPase MnmE [Anaerolineae bacterium]|nr:tRNA uridine-5-carboxymethylaminomethyl(34) synthesis GTPase MnmE [Gemmatimonadaceae bacterium]
MQPIPGFDDTIAAISTPPGRSAIAVIRLTGPRAHEIVARVVTPWRDTERSAYLTALCDPVNGELIDRPLVTVYRGPASYTGEDMAEISVHGGHVVPALALAALITAGARIAHPGEFTRRAVLNGKMDLLQAEAVGDIIDAGSRAMHHAALNQLDGGLTRRISALRESILELEALIAYDIDFPGEDDGPLAPQRIATATAHLVGSLDSVLATSETGELIRGGATVVIAGAPNVGKSSLFNALIGYGRAIVTDLPGTTRDALEALIDVGEWPVRLIDTAGIHETSDVIERLGIEVSEQWLRRADIVLACGDSTELLLQAVTQVTSRTAAPVLPVRTKGELASEGASIAEWPHPPVIVSAHTGAGLAELSRRIQVELTEKHGERVHDAPLLTRERHRHAVALAHQELINFEEAWHNGAVPVSIAAVHLRTATGALEDLIGIVGVEEVLGRVFSSFCVGK